MRFVVAVVVIFIVGESEIAMRGVCQIEALFCFAPVVQRRKRQARLAPGTEKIFLLALSGVDWSMTDFFWR